MHRRRPYVMVRDRGIKSLDERFTDFADTISEVMGKWWVSVIAFVLIVAWTLYCATTQGPGWWYGTFYNLPLNLVTTCIELFVGFLLASAANRVEHRNKSILDQQTRMLAHNQSMHERQLHLLELVEQLVEREQTELEHIEHDIEHKEH